MRNSVGKLTTPSCARFSNLIKLLGTFIFVLCLAADYAYMIKSTFSSKLYFTVFTAVLVVRILIPLILIVIYQVSNVCSKA